MDDAPTKPPDYLDQLSLLNCKMWQEHFFYIAHLYMFPPKKLQNCLEKVLVSILPVLSVSILEVEEQNTKRNFRIQPKLSIFHTLLVSN